MLAPLQIPYARYASPLLPAPAAGLGIALDALQERNRIVAAARAADGAARSAALSRGHPRSRGAPADPRKQASGVTGRLGAGPRSGARRAGRLRRHACPRTCAHPYPPWPETHGSGASSWGRERPVGRRSGTPWSGPRWIALPIPMSSSWWRPAPADFVNLGPPAAIDETCWPEQARFSPGAIGTRERFDAFFVPLDSFSDAIRPGPEVIVRRRVCGNSAGTRTR